MDDEVRHARAVVAGREPLANGVRTRVEEMRTRPQELARARVRIAEPQFVGRGEPGRALEIRLGERVISDVVVMQRTNAEYRIGRRLDVATHPAGALAPPGLEPVRDIVLHDHESTCVFVHEKPPSDRHAVGVNRPVELAPPVEVIPESADQQAAGEPALAADLPVALQLHEHPVAPGGEVRVRGTVDLAQPARLRPGRSWLKKSVAQNTNVNSWPGCRRGPRTPGCRSDRPSNSVSASASGWPRRQRFTIRG